MTKKRETSHRYAEGNEVPARLLESAAAAIVAGALAADDAREFLDGSLRQIRQSLEATSVLVARPVVGRWEVLSRVGSPDAPPTDLFSNVLDEMEVATGDGWMVAPLERHAASGELLACQLNNRRRAEIAAAELAQAALKLGEALASVRRREEDRRRCQRLETLLEITRQWNRAQEMEPLLTQIAESATRLLECDRASIFLWDRPNRMLVARPALGVEGGELRVPDDSGIVGQVLRSGAPRRVDTASGQEEINREVDRRLGYQTRTLLCVPLSGQAGERLGAFEAINKESGNFTDEDEAMLRELAAQASVALENTRQRERLLQSRRQISELAAQGVQLIGRSGAIQALRDTIQRVAGTELAVLILGENGTGKEVVSQLVHYLSARRDQPFIAVNCAALTETLLESELFGHEKGAFTDAHEARRGKFELASGGTLFLDEIAELSLGGQAKLLRVLEEKVVTRVGGSQAIHTDVRVIAATNQDLAALVAAKRFRQDLYFRLNVVTLQLPPLRERGDDVLLLAAHFLEDFCRRARRKVPELSVEARKRLIGHAWPGNVRELRNLMERLAYLCPGERVEAEDLAFILAPGGEAAAVPSNLALSEATERFQALYIQRAMERSGHSISDAARQLGMHRSNLYRKMRQLGIRVEADRTDS